MHVVVLDAQTLYASTSFLQFLRSKRERACSAHAQRMHLREPSRAQKINALQPQRELRDAERTRSKQLGPRKAPALKPLIRKPEAVPIPPQNLHLLAPARKKHEQAPRERIALQQRPHELRKPVNRLSHVHGLGTHVRPCRTGEDHRMRVTT